MSDSSGSQDIVSYDKESDFEDRDTSIDAKDVDFGSKPTISDAVPLSPFPDGGWRAWSVVVGVYVFFIYSWYQFQNNKFYRWLTQFCTFGYVFLLLFSGNFMTSQRQDTQTHLGCTMVSSRNILWLVKLILENRFLCSYLFGDH